MIRRELKSKRTGIIVISIIFIYLLLRIRNYTYYEFVVIPKVKPMAVWEFVADFSNMKYLNPTINEFSILAESGNYEHWKYTAKYSENLSHWPNTYNEAVAQFDIKSVPNKEIYLINSNHTTCLFFGLTCLESRSEFKFTKSDLHNVKCEETVQYQCPQILSMFCRREVEYQRNIIMWNLKKHFHLYNERLNQKN